MMKIILTITLILTMHGLYADPWGKDADLAYYKPKKETAPIQLPPSSFTPPNPLKLLAKGFIYVHQTLLTNADGPRSHCIPSSSEYMRTAIQHHGFYKGYIMGCDRLMRENDDPWIYQIVRKDGARYKWDPVPIKV